MPTNHTAEGRTQTDTAAPRRTLASRLWDVALGLAFIAAFALTIHCIIN